MDQTELRQKIREVRNNTDLDETEKKQMIQTLMMIPKEEEENVLLDKNNYAKSCEHYNKQCSQFQFDCCDGTIDPCHRCHIATRGCNKREVSSIVCNECNTRQPVSNQCIFCSIEFAHSFCEICKIWTLLDIYHCNDCGICRVGNKDDIFHCNHCNGCFSKLSIETHKCSQKKLNDIDCPICMESIHSSQMSAYILNCGHVVHQLCLNTLIQKNEYRCPTCRKSIGDMTTTWSNIRYAIQLQPIPNEFYPIYVGDIVETPYGNMQVTDRRKDRFTEGILGDFTNIKMIIHNSQIKKRRIVQILCNDCENKSEVEYHFLGLECSFCGGFNTNT